LRKFAVRILVNTYMAKNNKSDMTFLEHLEELRWHIIRSAIVIVAATVVAFIFKHIIVDIILLGPLHDDFATKIALCKLGRQVNHIMPWLISNPDAICMSAKPFELINTDLPGQFTTHIKISLICGLIIGFPYLIFEVWRFISPALYPHEKKHAEFAVLGISVLFFIGVLVGYYLINPLSLNFLVNYSLTEDLHNKFTLKSYISLVSSTVIASGVVFELPVFVFFLSKIGLVTPKFLKKYRKHSIVGILIIAAIITPSPDPFSQLLVSLPMLLLYEVCIIISKRVTKNREASNP
jgi:sec-independent protein translocase protein TatC